MTQNRRRRLYCLGCGTLYEPGQGVGLPKCPSCGSRRWEEIVEPIVNGSSEDYNR